MMVKGSEKLLIQSLQGFTFPWRLFYFNATISLIMPFNEGEIFWNSLQQHLLDCTKGWRFDSSKLEHT